MAYVNVKNWSVDQVTDWLKGLDNVILQYTTSFLNNGVAGHQLLNLRADDLEHLGVITLGHQEIILEAVEHLRTFHFELDKENLQMLALRLSCAANSLFKELLLLNDDCAGVQTQTMSDVHNIITTIKPLACWLDRAPFAGDKDYTENKTQLLQLGFEMATSAHRGIFSEKPVRTIRNICEQLAKIADHLIQEITDPMILQPASLDLATLKKKEQELGFLILPYNHAVHQIAEIKYGSPAHGCTKIEEGDEIVQVNYQTVVGWQRKKVMMLLQESPPEIVLTLKKRPRHTKVYGQIYMKPYRLPSRKRGDQLYSRWQENLPSPRLLPLLDLPPLLLPNAASIIETSEEMEAEELCSSDSESPDSPIDDGVRLFPIKPMPILQRRNTITGSTPTEKRPHLSVSEYWQLMKDKPTSTHSSSYNIGKSAYEEDPIFLRNQSTPCNIGLDISPRPTTVLGITTNKRTSTLKNDSEKSSSKKRVNFEDKTEQIEPVKETNIPKVFLDTSNLDESKSVSVNSLASLTNEEIAFIDEGRELTDRSSMVTDWKKEIVDELLDTLRPKSKSPGPVTPPTIPENQTGEEKSVSAVVKDSVLADVNIHNIIKKFDEKEKVPPPTAAKPKVFPRKQLKKPPEVPVKQKPAVPPRSATTKLRGRLDKSSSAPTYDTTEELPSDVPSVNTFHQELSKTTSAPSPDIKKDSLIEAKAENLETSANNSSITHNSNTASSASVSVNVSVSSSSVNLSEKLDDDSEILHVDESAPPKPPPRTFGVVDLPKPAYPSDSPKPANLIELVKNAQSTSKQVFEFPEPKSSPENIKAVSSSVSSLTEIHKDNSASLTAQEYGVTLELPTLRPAPSRESLKSKYFEPKVVSTPVKTKEGHSEVFSFRSPNYEVQKSVSDSKISPTNSIVRAMIYSGKSKAGKKKTNLLARRRKVAVSDLSPADMHGYLFQRLRHRHTQQIHWEKRFFVLLGNCLYGFKSKDDPKAACLIFLSGFTVAVATEVNSRSNAFKVYHTGTAFYFSTDDYESLQTWIDAISPATLHSDPYKNSDASLYSETDESDSEKQKTPTSEKNSESLRKFGSLKKFSSKKGSDSSPGGSTSLDRKWFFNKTSNNSSKHSLPVPTAQFRSYRKIKINEECTSVTTGNFTSHVPSFAPRSEIKTLSQSQNASVPNLSVEPIESLKMIKSKPKPLDYVHASNPSLCNISEYVPPTNIKKAFKQCNENLAGFVTLEELMNRQAEERKLNPHFNVENEINFNLIKPDVVYGEVPIRTKSDKEKSSDSSLLMAYKRGHMRTSSDSQKLTEKRDSGSSCFGKRLGSLKKANKNEQYDDKNSTYPKVARGFENKLNRSLPRTHKLQEGFVRVEDGSYIQASLDDVSFKKHSYEMIYCPQTITDVQFAQNRNLDDRMCQDTPKKSNKIKKQHSFTSADKKSSKLSFGGSKVSDSSCGKIKLKSAIQYTPMSLPLSQDPKSKPKFAFELNLDEKSTKSSSGGRLKQIFGKSSEQKKEKTFLGSPKLHRAIFKRHNSGSDISLSNSSSPSLVKNESSEDGSCQTVSIDTSQEYQTEYPAVFESDSYSSTENSVNIRREISRNRIDEIN